VSLIERLEKVKFRVRDFIATGQKEGHNECQELPNHRFLKVIV
jgi:hypothetical protein